MNAELGCHFAEAAAPSSIDELDAAICALARQMNAETYRLLVLIREFDERFGWAKWSFGSCAEWLAWRCQLSLSAAREKVRTAHALRRMPSIAQAFADGRLSYSKVRALTRVAEPQDEGRLLAYALSATAVQVEERCREIRNGGPESVGGARRAWERRALVLRRDVVRGVLAISVEVPLVDGELIAQALERAVAAGEVALGIEFELGNRPFGVCDGDREPSAGGWRAQQADALVAIAKAYLAGSAASAEEVAAAPAADHYQVVVHVDDSALRGSAGRSDLPIETVKRLACDGSVVTVVEDEDGTPLDVGRKRRTVSTALRRALVSRDRCCSFPGCRNRRYLQAHHLRHWAEGGATSLVNLTLLCSHHHRLLHEGGFTVRRESTRELCFRRADGRVIPRHGYRLEDIVDDFEDAPRAKDAEPAERTAPAKRTSAEVRESAPA